jgi:hypothetical protein
MCEDVACNPMQYPGKEWPKSKLEYRRLKEIAAKVRNSLFAVYDIRVDGQASACFADVQTLIHERVWWDWGEAAVLLAAASSAPHRLYPPDAFRGSEILAKERDPSTGSTYVVSYTDPNDAEEFVAIMRKTPDGYAQKLCEGGREGLHLTHKTKPRYSILFRGQRTISSECYSLNEIRDLVGTGRVADLAQRLVFRNTFRLSDHENLAAVIGYQTCQSCPLCGRALKEVLWSHRREVPSVWGLWSVGAYLKRYVCRACTFRRSTLDETFTRWLLARHCFRSAFVFGCSGVIDPLQLVRSLETC